jgi:diguanylate cyclase (GGDEF)-like protein/PAS domain S-box-containing protein
MVERADERDPIPESSEQASGDVPRLGEGALFRALRSNSSDVIAVLNADTTVRYVSPAVEKLLGHQPGEVTGSPALDLVHPDDQALVTERMALPATDFDARSPMPLRLRQADGAWRHVEVTGANRLEDPTVGGIIVNIRDLTESLAQTDALRQQRDLFEAVINSAASLVLVTDAVGRIVRYNRACERLTGVSARRVLGRMMWEVLVDPAEVERIKTDFARLEPADLPSRTILAWRTPSGDEVIVEWTASAILGRDGGVEFVVVTGVDMTRQRREEEQLRRSEARLRQLAEHTTDLICTIDPHRGLLTYASPSWSRLGYDPASLIGRSVEELVHPEEVDALRTPIERLVRDGGSAAFEARLRSAGDEWAWFETRAQAVLGEHGAVREVQLSSRDVEARRQAEQELVRRALHDPLTGLPNRTLLLDRLTTALRRAARIEGSLAVLFCDLDGFKQVNDNFGHLVGDLALVEVAQRLEAACRPLDTVARMGGDEFVVLAEGVEATDAVHRLADRIRSALAEPIVAGEAKVVLSVSVGVATSHGGGHFADELLVEADRAMYADKRARRATPERA